MTMHASPACPFERLRWTAEHWNDDSLANLGADYDS